MRWIVLGICSVGGYIPDAPYKAPLALLQSGRVALGIVPDLAALDRPARTRCNQALDLDVLNGPSGPLLSVGFMPARLAYHSVYAPDPGRTWTTDAPLVNAYYVLVTASAEPTQDYQGPDR